MRAKNVMTEEVITVNAGASVLEAARLLVNAQVSAMPVIDNEGIMVGILSEADVIRHTGGVAPTDLSNLAEAIKAMDHVRSRRVGDVMTTSVVTVTEDTTLREVAELIMRNGIKRVPVLRDRSVVGMVSRVDLLQALISVGLESYTQAPAEAQYADERMRTAVMTVLLRLNWPQTRRGAVVILKGVVHLWGMMASDAQRSVFIEAVRSVPGVTSVANHMHVGRAVTQS
jgi:CBS domain-containing protein